MLLGRPGLAGGDLEVAVAAEQLALGRARLEFAGDDADRDAGRAIDAARAIGDLLAAAEADPAQRLVELAGVRPLSSVNTLRSALPGRYGQGDGVRHEETRKAEGCAHRLTSLEWFRDLFMRLVTPKKRVRAAISTDAR